MIQEIDARLLDPVELEADVVLTPHKRLGVDDAAGLISRGDVDAGLGVRTMQGQVTQHGFVRASKMKDRARGARGIQSRRVPVADNLDRRVGWHFDR